MHVSTYGSENIWNQLLPDAVAQLNPFLCSLECNHLGAVREPLQLWRIIKSSQEAKRAGGPVSPGLSLHVDPKNESEEEKQGKDIRMDSERGDKRKKVAALSDQRWKNSIVR